MKPISDSLRRIQRSLEAVISLFRSLRPTTQASITLDPQSGLPKTETAVNPLVRLFRLVTATQTVSLVVLFLQVVLLVVQIVLLLVQLFHPEGE